VALRAACIQVPLELHRSDSTPKHSQADEIPWLADALAKEATWPRDFSA